MAALPPLDAARSRAWEGGASFSRANRLYRLAFGITWTLLAAWTPPPMRGWRRWLLRRFGATLAPTANVYGSARIWSPANLIMDDYAAIGPRATIYAMAPIRLGPYAIVSQGAHLCAGTHDIESADFQLRSSPIHVGARAWIAAEAFVGPGVEVGDGAVLGARGCAMRNLDAWTVYSGNPAAPIRPRRLRFGNVGKEAGPHPLTE
jgi:putative colanic acid biosynthesis acetyltransferase WcaF